MSGSTSTNAASTPAPFQIYSGQIFDSTGAVFKARGMDVEASQMGDANKILADFPGLNFIRLNVFSYQSPGTYAAFINTMTSNGVVVELEDHNSSDGSNQGGGRGTVFTGTQLSNELNWYSSVAQAYASNPYVWFGTDNEPPTTGLSPWQGQTYDAIRNTGNTNPILIELPGGAWPDGQTVISYGMDPKVYAGMSNIIADVHLYGWSSRYVPDQSTVNATLTNMIQGVQTIPSLNGTVPVILGEYGPSTEGVVADANATQVIQAAQQSTQTSGALAFAWSVPGADSLTDGQGHLTSYGQTVAKWIAAGAPPSGITASLVSNSTFSQANGSSFVTSSSGMSFITGANSNGGSVYALPTAGNGVLAFSGDILNTRATLDLTAALAATDWNGAGSTLAGYLSVTDASQGAVISVAKTFNGLKTPIANIPGATTLNLDTLLGHAYT